MAFPGSNYAPPSVYTKTLSESPLSGALSGLKVPVLIGTGSEILTQKDLELVRGSSSTVDQQVVNEDLSGRKVLNELASGEVTLGEYTQESIGEINMALSSSSSSSSVPFQVQVRHYPIVTGDGTGTTTTKASDVSVTLNGSPVVVMALDGAKGLLTLSETPKKGDSLKVTYFFNRTDTLVTDDVSDQVTAAVATLYFAKGETFNIVETTDAVDGTDTLDLTVDGTEVSIVFTADSAVDADTMVSEIKAGAGTTSLSAATFTNNHGEKSVYMTADNEIVVGSGNANSTLGLSKGQSAGRNAVFYTFNGPIVDGSNGGVTTTDVADVTVKVDGTQVIPVSVDGATRAVTLENAPASGATVTIQYYFNTWQDTFDYLAHTGITEIDFAGLSAGKSDFVEGVDFILKDDKLYWGTAALVASGEHTTGYEYLTDAQITANLVDNKGYLEPCSAVVDTTVSPAIASRTKFTLPFTPTTGNGRGTPIGISLFQTVSNGRIDLPTNRPDLIKAYWGYNVQDALDRGAVDVLKVDHTSAQVTLKEAVPVGASVWATFYYNVIQDTTYNVVVASADVSGVGTYTMTDKNGSPLYVPKFTGKSAALSTVTVQFPSGSELLSDARFESPYSAKNFTGAVEETVTVTFVDKADTPAAYALKSKAPFYFIDGNSSTFDVSIDGAAAVSVNLTAAYKAHVLGDVVTYADPSTRTNTITEGSDDNLIFTVDGVQVDVTLGNGSQAMADLITDINDAAKAELATFVAKSKVNGNFVVGGNNNEFQIQVPGSAGSPYTVTVGQTTYGSADQLAAAIQVGINAAGTGQIDGSTGTDVKINCTATSKGEIKFTFEQNAAPAGTPSFVKFTSTSELAKQLGLDTSEIHVGDGAAGDYLVAEAAVDTASGGNYYYDRIRLLGRIKPASPIGADQSGITVDFSNCDDTLGLSTGDYGASDSTATVAPATMYGEIGLTGKVESLDKWPAITFVGADQDTAQNNVFKLTVDGTAIEITFKDNANGAITSGSEVALSGANVTHDIITQINTASQTAISSDIASAEGLGIRLTSPSQGSESSIVIGDGSATTLLGFTKNQSASRTAATSAQLVGSVQSNFSTDAVAGLIKDEAGAEYMYLQSKAIGLGSSITLASCNALRRGTNLTDSAGDGNVGEAGVSGFVVTSDISTGSGSVDNSVLNAGTGQDGVVGQTYRDLVTGLTFTVLPRPTGAKYPATSTLTFTVAETITTDANLPIPVVKGVSLVVANTEDIAEGDTAVITTFQRGGEQPEVGDTYYATYKYGKQDFIPRVFTKLSAIESTFGSLSPDNPLTLGAYLALTNGAVILGLKQVQKDSDPVGGVNTTASVTAYRDAIDSMTGTFAGGTNPDILVSLRGDSLELYQYMTKHANIQSSILWKSERTIIGGCAAGTTRAVAQNWAGQIEDTRFRLTYPDMAYMTITDAFGNSTRNLIDGTYLACALAGSIVSPSKDVATPWTNTRLFGFDSLARENDAVQKNKLAAAGVTVLEDRPTGIRVRHGLTTDLSNILTKTPTVIQISDQVQQNARNALEKYVGTKFLAGVTSNIEGTLSMTLKDLVRKEIIASYTGVKAAVADDDPTVALVEAYYQPVFPLLYLVVTFNLRANL